MVCAFQGFQLMYCFVIPSILPLFGINLSFVVLTILIHGLAEEASKPTILFP